MNRRKNPPLILASGSPRRAELLDAAGYEYSVIPSPAPEPARKPAAIPVELWPMCLAYIKAAAVKSTLPRSGLRTQNAGLIVAADTIVVMDSPTGPVILNKPVNRAHARRMLTLLSGKLHRVITGLCLLSGHRHRLASAQAVCRIRRFPPRRLDSYLDSNLWKGKAGAYGIQDRDDPFVTLLEGDITTVIGLPMALLKRELADFSKE